MDAVSMLFVEDEEDLRTLMFEALSERGYAVTLARNGRDAIEALRGPVQFSHVVTDVNMPNGVSGLQVALEAAQLQPQADVVLASGYQRAQLPALPPGTRFLPKPYRLWQLFAAIEGPA